VTDDSGALLVVDDEQFLREAVAAFLSSLGFTVTSAETGIQALRTARARHFELLILDAMLPELDGFEIVEWLRKDRNQVPVIFLTAKDTARTRSRGPPSIRTGTRSGATAASSSCLRPSSGCYVTHARPARMLTHAELLANVWDHEFIESKSRPEDHSHAARDRLLPAVSPPGGRR